MFVELKKVKYFNEITDLKSYGVKYFKEIKRYKSVQKRGVFITQASIYDGAFLWIYLTAYYFRNKSSIIVVWLVYKQASKNIEVIKVKLTRRKPSGLLQGVAFLVYFQNNLYDFYIMTKYDSNRLKDN